MQSNQDKINFPSSQKKTINKKGNKNPQNQEISDGSASAFDATENVQADNKTDEDNNDLAFRNGK